MCAPHKISRRGSTSVSWRLPRNSRQTSGISDHEIPSPKKGEAQAFHVSWCSRHRSLPDWLFLPKMSSPSVAVPRLRGHRRRSNKSLERTTVDRGSFAAHADGGRRSAHRWGNIRFTRKSSSHLWRSRFQNPDTPVIAMHRLVFFRRHRTSSDQDSPRSDFTYRILGLDSGRASALSQERVGRPSVTR